MMTSDPLRDRWPDPVQRLTEADSCPTGAVAFFVFLAIVGAGCFALGYTASVWGWL